MATVIADEKAMTEEEYRNEFYRILGEIDSVRDGFKVRDAHIAELRTETAEIREESRRINADIRATLDRIATMR